VTQLKNQDPLDPVKNQDFIAQLAQFNSLEQMINLNTNFSSMNTMQSLAQSANFIGKEVAWQDSSGASQTGVVSAIEVQNNVPMLVVNGNLLKISDVLAIASGT
jgi:flagellar basal-body rod modification protein FlgD